MHKTCGNCGEEKLLCEFTRASAGANFRGGRTPHHAYCRACNAKRAREWRSRNTNYRGSGRILSIPKEDRMLMSAIRCRISSAKGRCKKLKRKEPILTDTYLYELFLLQNRKCALTGAPLSLAKDDPLCLSLDQIDPEKGYIEGNVQWLAWCVNRAKGDLALNDFYDMCSVVLEYRKVQRPSKGVGQKAA